ncbi:unspecified product [Leishmania tarentolae]|uniref:Unspecified product n=1 Tax=Leishmania tarentolae TaxID=5689 RepID=A0A640K9C3_LEITA|nr:unspecified product [Leishmania tarentolae]
MVHVPASKLKQRSIVCCAAPTVDVEVSSTDTPHKQDAGLVRSTVCMDYHILSRIEDDVRRASMRQDNPDSAMPIRDYDPDEETIRIVNAHRSMRSV